MNNKLIILIVLSVQILGFSTSALSSSIVLTPEEKQWLADHSVIRIGPDPDFAPIEAITSEGEYVGMAADYVKLIEEKAGFKFELIKFPNWSAATAGFENGEIDVFPAVTSSPARLQFMTFSTAHIRLPGMIIISDRTSGDVVIDDLKSLKVAAPAGYVWFDLIGADHPDIDLIAAPSLKEALRDLSFGVIDAVVADPATVNQVIREEGISNLRIGGETGYFFNLAFGVRKDWPELQGIIEKTVQSITEEEHQAIFDDWIQLSGGEGVSKTLLTAVAIGLAIVVLIALGFMFVNMLLRTRVKQQTEALNVAYEQLSQSNVELEERVSERTLDLEKALNELTTSQVKLVQSEKMAALGQMIAGVAHEINTPLGYAHSNVTIMKDFVQRVKIVEERFSAWKNMMSNEETTEEEISNKFEEVDSAFADLNDDDEIDECFELANDTLYGLDQISDITQNLKDFSRLDKAETVDANLNDNLKRTLKLAKNLLRENIKIKLLLGDIPLVKCNPSRINQVFLNLITNACHAIEQAKKDPGVLTIKTEFDGDHVHVVIQDNGVGMSSDVGKKMFDPFYTTKAVGEGTGLGLSISYNIIVKEHKGKISVRTREGVGTRFSIRFAANNTQKIDQAAQQTETQALTG
jgi:signal transduction histidine kinase